MTKKLRSRAATKSGASTLAGVLGVALAALVMAPAAHGAESTTKVDDPEVVQRCAQVAVELPARVIVKVRFKRGLPIGSYGREKWTVRFFYTAMPSECRQVVKRLHSQGLQLQDPRNHRRWRNLMRRNWVGIHPPENAAWEGGTWSTSAAPAPGKKKIIRVNYECTPGKGVTGARVRLRAKAQAKQPGHPILATRIYVIPAKVVGAC